MGTMGYKYEAMAGNGEKTTAMLSKTQVNLKIIPGVDGHPEICQLVGISPTLSSKAPGSAPAGCTSYRMSMHRSRTSRCAG